MRRIAVAIALVSLPLAWAATAAADPPDRSGWWWQANNDTVTGLGVATPSPPDAPQGGLYVAGTKSQPLAVGAVHLVSDVQGGTATLTLHAANGGFAAAPGLLACPTHSYWAPVEAGPWSQAPQAECDAAGGGVAGTAAGDGSSMTWKLTSAFEVEPGEWNVVVVPGDAPVRVGIDAPGDDAIAVTGGAPASSGFDAGSPESLSEFPVDAGSTAPAFDAGALSLSPSSPLSLPGLAAPGAGAGVPAPAPDPSASAPAPSAGTATPAVPAAASVPGPARGKRVMAFVLLLALAAALWWLGGSPSREPHHLGALAGAGGGSATLDDGRGIGRFRRPRDERPERL